MNTCSYSEESKEKTNSIAKENKEKEKVDSNLAPKKIIYDKHRQSNRNHP